MSVGVGREQTNSNWQTKGFERDRNEMMFLGSVALCTVDGLQSVKHMFLKKSCVLIAVRDDHYSAAVVIFIL
jgi:hypothetical protein